MPDPDFPVGGVGTAPTAGDPGSMMRPGLSWASLCAVDKVDLSRMKLSSVVLAGKNLPYFLYVVHEYRARFG